MDQLLSHVRNVLAATPARWTALAASIDGALFARAPAPGEWSALACLQHLLDTEPLAPARIDALMAGRDFAAFNPDEEGNAGQPVLGPAELAAEFARLRELSLHRLAQVNAGDLDRTARHATLGMVTMAELLHNWAAHDLMHTVQAERALMQPLIDGLGPWRRHYTDHIMHTGAV